MTVDTNHHAATKNKQFNPPVTKAAHCLPQPATPDYWLYPSLYAPVFKALDNLADTIDNLTTLFTLLLSSKLCPPLTSCPPYNLKPELLQPQHAKLPLPRPTKANHFLSPSP